MKLSVNGEEREVDDGCTISQLLSTLDLGGGPVAVERNGAVVPRREHATTALCSGDALEIVHFVGGG